MAEARGRRARCTRRGRRRDRGSRRRTTRRRARIETTAVRQNAPGAAAPVDSFVLSLPHHLSSVRGHSERRDYGARRRRARDCRGVESSRLTHNRTRRGPYSSHATRRSAAVFRRDRQGDSFWHANGRRHCSRSFLTTAATALVLDSHAAQCGRAFGGRRAAAGRRTRHARRRAPSASLTTRQEVDGENTSSHATVLESKTRVCTRLTLSCLWPHREHFLAARSDCPFRARSVLIAMRGRQRKGRARTALFRRFWPIAACRVACRVLRSRHTRVKKRP